MMIKQILLPLLLCACMIYTVQAQVIEIDNLGPSVNSDYSELNPIISADGRTLYFIRANHPRNLHGDSATQDIWYSTLGDNGLWQPAIHAGPELNRSRFNTLYHVSVDGNRMLIGGSYFDGINWGVGFSSIERKGDKWTEPVFLTIKKFEDMCRGDFSSVCLLPDNKTMILSFSEEDDSQINNLYVSFRQPNGKWSAPKPLGTDINTAYDETTPFMAPDGVTLYFASDRPGGYGSKDIYMSRRLDDTWFKWSSPVNLGPPINTERAEGYYTIPASGKEGYMVSHRNKSGKSDIIRIKTVENTRPIPVLLVSGRVLNAKTKTPVEATITYEVLTGTDPEGSCTINTYGDYKLILACGRNYGISAKAKGFVPVSLHFDLTNRSEYLEENKDLLLVPIETGQVVRLNNIFFDSNKSLLKPESFPELNRLIRVMKDHSGMLIELSGHSDDTGDDDVNMKISLARADAVKKYLEEHGIKSSRVVSKGFGKTKPVADNTTEEGRQLNRRVEFVILKN